MTISYLFNRGLHKIFKHNMIKDSHIHSDARLCYDIQLVGCTIGRFTYIGEHSVVLSTKVGAFCSIADNCIIGGPGHAINFVSTSPVFTKGRNIFGVNFGQKCFEEYSETVIENDVWIGSGALIKAGVTIGTGAVIGMGSVVTHDVGAYEIWAGNPARLIRERFSDELSQKLLETRWWELEKEKLNQIGQYVDNPEKWCEVLKNNG